jgi:hypothetical protein
VKDLLLGSDGDLRLEGGDFVVGESTIQHQNLLLLLDKGSLRQRPTRGVGIMSWQLSENPARLNAAIKREFEADGMIVHRVRKIGDDLQIEASYA